MAACSKTYLFLLKFQEDGTIKEFSVGIEDTSTLMEIKDDLIVFIKEVNLSFTLKAIASFSRMSEFRLKIVQDLLENYEDYFKCEFRSKEMSVTSCGSDCMVVSAHSRSGHSKYFEVTWSLKWNKRKMRIQHVFIIDRLQGTTLSNWVLVFSVSAR